VPLLDIIPLSMLNKSYRSKNSSTSSTTVIVIIIAKYPKNFIYLLTITRIVLATSLVLILVGGKPIIKSIINSNIGPYRIGSVTDLILAVVELLGRDMSRLVVEVREALELVEL
jgi:hypothetical protein